MYRSERPLTLRGADRHSPSRGSVASRSTVRRDLRVLNRPTIGTYGPERGDLPLKENLIAIIPAHYPERWPWLQRAIRSAEDADRILVIADYERPTEPRLTSKVDWVTVPELRTTGSKYRRAAELTDSDDILSIVDDDDWWHPQKVGTVRRVFGERPDLQYLAHSGAKVREERIVGVLGPTEANATMISVRHGLLDDPRVGPFFRRLDWGGDSFLRYAPLAAGTSVELLPTTLAYVRYHDTNHTHPPDGYRNFVEWQRTDSTHHLAAWKLIAEMMQPTGRRPIEIDEKIAEFARRIDMSPVLRMGQYLLRRT